MPSRWKRVNEPFRLVLELLLLSVSDAVVSDGVSSVVVDDRVGALDRSDKDSEPSEDIEDRSVLDVENVVDLPSDEPSDKVTILIPMLSLPDAGMKSVVGPSLSFNCCLCGW